MTAPAATLLEGGQRRVMLVMERASDMAATGVREGRCEVGTLGRTAGGRR